MEAAAGAPAVSFGAEDQEWTDRVGEISVVEDGDEHAVSWQVEGSSEAFEMLRFNPSTKLVRIFPLTRQSMGFEPEFDRIRELQLTLDWEDIPPTEVSDYTGLLRVLSLPAAFNPVFAYGLGLTRAYRGIVSEIEKATDCSVVRFVDADLEGPDGDIFSVRLQRLEDYRRTVDRTYQRAGVAGSRVIDAEAHNAVSDLTGCTEVTPKFGTNPTIRMITEEVASGHLTTQADRVLLVEELARQAPQVAAESPEHFGRLREDLELVSLETLITQYDAGLEGPQSRDEAHWQRFFTANPFALQQVFAAPILVV